MTVAARGRDVDGAPYAQAWLTADRAVRCHGQHRHTRRDPVPGVRAGEQARKTNCLSNEKQLGTAFVMCSQDYDEMFPSVKLAYNASAGESWPSIVWPGSVDWMGVFTHGVGPYITNAQVLQCPSGRSGGDRWADARAISCGYNEYLYDTNRGYAKQAALASAPAGIACVVIVCETFASGIVNDWEPGGPTLRDGANDGLNRVRCGNYSPWQADHDGTNLVYGDGHAKFIAKGAMRSYRATSNNADLRQRPIISPNCVEP